MYRDIRRPKDFPIPLVDSLSSHQTRSIIWWFTVSDPNLGPKEWDSGARKVMTYGIESSKVKYSCIRFTHFNWVKNYRSLLNIVLRVSYQVLGITKNSGKVLQTFQSVRIKRSSITFHYRYRLTYVFVYTLRPIKDNSICNFCKHFYILKDEKSLLSIKSIL